jgi:hypothetical protein
VRNTFSTHWLKLPDLFELKSKKFTVSCKYLHYFHLGRKHLARAAKIYKLQIWVFVLRLLTKCSSLHPQTLQKPCTHTERATMPYARQYDSIFHAAKSFGLYQAVDGSFDIDAFDAAYQASVNWASSAFNPSNCQALEWEDFVRYRAEYRLFQNLCM